MNTVRVWNWFDSEGNSGTYYPPSFGLKDAANNFEWCRNEAESFKSRGDVCMARSKQIQAEYWRKRVAS